MRPPNLLADANLDVIDWADCTISPPCIHALVCSYGPEGSQAP